VAVINARLYENNRHHIHVFFCSVKNSKNEKKNTFENLKKESKSLTNGVFDKFGQNIYDFKINKKTQI